MISRKLNSLALLGSLLSGIIVSHASASELKMISQIQVPGEPLDAFDISFVDQKTGYYFLADRSNNSVDIVDGKTLKVSAQVRGFAGVPANKNTDVAGPNGVLTVGDEVWASDGDSTVKVIDLRTRKIVDTIRTGGKKRADEMAYDPKHHILLVANDADDPPFVTLISTRAAHKILGKIEF